MAHLSCVLVFCALKWDFFDLYNRNRLCQNCSIRIKLYLLSLRKKMMAVKLSNRKNLFFEGFANFWFHCFDRHVIITSVHVYCTVAYSRAPCNIIQLDSYVLCYLYSLYIIFCLGRAVL
jgi:hypothetical protein